MRKTELEVRAEYADLLDTDGDDSLLRLVTDLDAGLATAEPPPALWNASPRALPGNYMERMGAPAERRRLLRWPRVSLPAAVTVLVFLLAVRATLAVNNITDLGRPTNAVPATGPLSSFRRIGTVLRQHGKPELLFIGTQLDEYSAVIRWPVVKALDQFGTLSNVQPSGSLVCYTSTSWYMPVDPSKVTCHSAYDVYVSHPTFDWTHAQYRSRYLVFVHKDLINLKLQMQQSLTPQEVALFNRYARPVRYASLRDAVWHDVLFPGGSNPLPLVSVGGYLDTGTNLATPGDMTPITSTAPAPFDEIQKSLQRDKPVDHLPYSLVADYNAEANILTALICHADGHRPASVCDRSVIRDILRHVK